MTNLLLGATINWFMCWLIVTRKFPSHMCTYVQAGILGKQPQSGMAVGMHARNLRVREDEWERRPEAMVSLGHIENSKAR